MYKRKGSLFCRRRGGIGLKKILRIVVLVMCLAWLLSALGCKGLLVDGPGMERKIWSEFTLSRCTVRYEPIYTYTVQYDEDRDEAYFHVQVHEGQELNKGMMLDKDALSALLNLNMLSYEDAEPIDGAVLGFSVVDTMDQSHDKMISGEQETQILEILDPYLTVLAAEVEEDPFMLDGPSMEYTPPWTAFSISRSSSNTLYSFWFTVTDSDSDTLVTGECQDRDGRSYEEQEGIPISMETLEALRLMELEHLEEAVEWPEGTEMPLDDDLLTLTVTLADGTVVKKNASGDLSIEIYELLLPYLSNQ